MSAQAPCLDCNDRELGCHSKCRLYLKFIKERAKENELIKNERNKDALTIGHIVNTVRRNQKHRNR